MAAHPVSPLAPKSYPDLPAIAGVRFATAEAGIKYKNRTDVLLMAFDEGTTAAGVLTRSKCSSAAVDWCRANLPGGTARGLVVNSGNANAFTGKSGRAATTLTAKLAAQALSCPANDVFLASTGVIGEPLEASKFAHLLGGLAKSATADGWPDTARAIMTTDTFPKLATRTAKIGGYRPSSLIDFEAGRDVEVEEIAHGLAVVVQDADQIERHVAHLMRGGADVRARHLPRRRRLHVGKINRVAGTRLRRGDAQAQRRHRVLHEGRPLRTGRLLTRLFDKSQRQFSPSPRKFLVSVLRPAIRSWDRILVNGPI